MAVCVPVRDMKDTAKFTELVEREREVTVTKNGYNCIHCVSDDEWRTIMDVVAKAQLYERIVQSEREFTEGNWVDYDEAVAQIKADYGL